MIITESKRLTIEKLNESDSSFIYELLNSPNWVEYIGDKGIRTENDAVEYIKNNIIKSYDIKGYGLYKMILKLNNRPIGICGFLKRDYLANVDIGFAILPEFEGKGFTYEAVIKVMEYGFSNLKLKTIMAITTENNIKSRNLLVKIGLNEIGKIKSNENKEEFILYSN